MSGDQNQNQNQQKQKGGNQNGPKEGITIATSVIPSQQTTLGQQVQNTVVTCIGGVIAAMACAGAERVRLDCWQVDWPQCSPRLQRDSHRPYHWWLWQHHAGTAHCCWKQSR